MKTPRYTQAQVKKALVKTKGMITLTAVELGCDPTTVRNYLTRFPALQQVLTDQRDNMGDVAELKLLQAIQAGEPWAIALYLKTQGKGRGYVERIEQTGKNGDPIEQHTTIKVIYADPDADPA